jgi:hypothetical protein
MLLVPSCTLISFVKATEKRKKIQTLRLRIGYLKESGKRGRERGALNQEHIIKQSKREGEVEREKERDSDCSDPT